MQEVIGRESASRIDLITQVLTPLPTLAGIDPVLILPSLTKAARSARLDRSQRPPDDLRRGTHRGGEGEEQPEIARRRQTGHV